MKTERSDKIPEYSSIISEWRRREVISIKEENRRLSETIDKLTLELLLLREVVRDKGNGKSNRRTTKEAIKPTVKVSSTNGTESKFPVVLSENAKFYSRLLYPTKKLAYYYAVLGVKNTIKIIISRISRKSI